MFELKYFSEGRVQLGRQVGVGGIYRYLGDIRDITESRDISQIPHRDISKILRKPKLVFPIFRADAAAGAADIITTRN